jgi:hypothetical protein
MNPTTGRSRADVRTTDRELGGGAGVRLDADADGGAPDALPAHTWVRTSAGGTVWWGCTACAKRHPAVTESGAASTARRHADGPIHRRNVGRLNGEDDRLIRGRR